MSYDQWKLRSPDDDRELSEGRQYVEEAEGDPEGNAASALIAERDLFKRRLATSEECRNNLFVALQRAEAANERMKAALVRIEAHSRSFTDNEIQHLCRAAIAS